MSNDGDDVQAPTYHSSYVELEVPWVFQHRVTADDAIFHQKFNVLTVPLLQEDEESRLPTET
jgi:hypothetical protein